MNNFREYFPGGSRREYLQQFADLRFAKIDTKTSAVISFNSARFLDTIIDAFFLRIDSVLEELKIKPAHIHTLNEHINALSSHMNQLSINRNSFVQEYGPDLGALAGQSYDDMTEDVCTDWMEARRELDELLLRPYRALRVWYNHFDLTS